MAGLKCLWQVERDEYCLKILNKHWPDVQKFNDVTTLKNPPYVDLICGGFPCQDVSVAGKRKGLKGERSGLWSEMLRLICEVRPKYVVVENVEGLLTKGFGTVLGALAQSRYDAEWEVLPAISVGAFHIRKRIFIIAYDFLQRNIKKEDCTSSKSNIPNTNCNGESSILQNNNCSKKIKKKTYTQQEETSSYNALIRSTNTITFCKRYSKDFPDWAGGDFRRPYPITKFERSTNREVECDFHGVAHGISSRLDRLKCLGNAVVPQVAEYLGKLIMQAENQRV